MSSLRKISLNWELVKLDTYKKNQPVDTAYSTNANTRLQCKPLRTIFMIVDLWGLKVQIDLIRKTKQNKTQQPKQK